MKMNISYAAPLTEESLMRKPLCQEIHCILKEKHQEVEDFRPCFLKKARGKCMISDKWYMVVDKYLIFDAKQGQREGGELADWVQMAAEILYAHIHLQTSSEYAIWRWRSRKINLEHKSIAMKSFSLVNILFGLSILRRTEHDETTYNSILSEVSRIFPGLLHKKLSKVIMIDKRPNPEAEILRPLAIREVRVGSRLISGLNFFDYIAQVPPKAELPLPPHLEPRIHNSIDVRKAKQHSIPLRDGWYNGVMSVCGSVVIVNTSKLNISQLFSDVIHPVMLSYLISRWMLSTRNVFPHCKDWNVGWICLFSLLTRNFTGPYHAVDEFKLRNFMRDLRKECDYRTHEYFTRNEIDLPATVNTSQLTKCALNKLQSFFCPLSAELSSSDIRFIRGQHQAFNDVGVRTRERAFNVRRLIEQGEYFERHQRTFEEWAAQIFGEDEKSTSERDEDDPSLQPIMHVAEPNSVDSSLNEADLPAVIPQEEEHSLLNEADLQAMIREPSEPRQRKRRTRRRRRKRQPKRTRS